MIHFKNKECDSLEKFSNSGKNRRKSHLSIDYMGQTRNPTSESMLGCNLLRRSVRQAGTHGVRLSFSSWEVEVGELGILGQPQIHCKVKTRLDSMSVLHVHGEYFLLFISRKRESSNNIWCISEYALFKCESLME